MADDLDDTLKKSIKDLLKLYNIELEEGALEEKGTHKEIDLAEVVFKTKEKLEDLTSQMQQVYQKTGMTKEQIEAYSRNPNNFTKEQWEMLEKVRGECAEFKEKAYSLFPAGQLKKAENAPAAAKKKKGKSVQKKDWLQT